MKVAQCWDDGVVNDIRLIELLHKYNAKATFNLNPGLIPEHTEKPSWLLSPGHTWSHKGFRCGKVGKAELYDTYKDFQVASHCWCHENAGTIPDEQFLKAAMDARKFLEDLFQKDCPGFAWPCGRATPETCRLLRENGFQYGRMVGNTDWVTRCSDTMMLMPSCHYQDGNFYAQYEQAKQNDGVFYFWGHSYEMFEYDPLWEQLELKLKFISEDPEAEWIDVKDIVPLCTAEQPMQP